MNAEPTMAELVRRIEALIVQVTRLSEDLKRDYLPRESYNLARDADRDDVAHLAARMDATEKQRAADRRLIVTAFVAPIVVALILLYVAAQIGGTK